MKYKIKKFTRKYKYVKLTLRFYKKKINFS